MKSPLPYARPKMFIIVWIGEPQVVAWDGEGIRLPGDGAVISDAKTHRFLSAQDAQGQWLPGTTVLKAEDRFNEKTGNIDRVFDPEAWCRGAFGDETQTGPAYGMTQRGLRILSDVSDITAELLAECREEWENAQDSLDQDRIQAELRRRKGYEKDGKEAPPLTAKAEVELQQAMNRQQTRNARKNRSAISTSDLTATLAGQAVAQPAAAVAPAPTPRPQITEAARRSIEAVLKTAENAGIALSAKERAAIEGGDRMAINELLERIAEKKDGAPQVASAAAPAP